MRSMPSETVRKATALILAAALCSATMLCTGCIADTAEDSDLPWASGQSWEGMMPLPGGMMDRYD